MTVSSAPLLSSGSNAIISEGWNEGARGLGAGGGGAGGAGAAAALGGGGTGAVSGAGSGGGDLGTGNPAALRWRCRSNSACHRALQCSGWGSSAPSGGGGRCTMRPAPGSGGDQLAVRDARAT